LSHRAERAGKARDEEYDSFYHGHEILLVTWGYRRPPERDPDPPEERLLPELPLLPLLLL
jgi:hypothetical protein